MTKANDRCPRSPCGGTMQSGTVTFTEDPQPSAALKCDACGQVLLIIDEPGRPKVEVWLIDWSHLESFREFVERARRGD
ncbi:MAG: hypothetical protein AAB734_03245, partial [Patescibacteria group bacterium]